MSHIAPPVIISLPAREELPAEPLELLVSRYEWGVEVDFRPAGSSAAWTPIHFLGGRVEVRES